jgi:hypothetical protein
MLRSRVELDIVVEAYNPNTWETEARGLQIQGQDGLYNENLSPDFKKKKSGVTLRNKFFHYQVII